MSMIARNRRVWGMLAVGLAVVVAGCVPLGDLLNADFAASVLQSQRVSLLPGEAPGFLVTVRNQTNRVVEMVVSYRDGDGDVQNYTSLLDKGDKASQMLICPVEEITLGNVANLNESGVRVALVENVSSATDPSQVPSTEVEAFGVLLRSGVNYDCGDSIEFVVRPSSATRSGYETVAYFKLADDE
jgi:hypothetical protein